jgi:hypothetical protein
MENNECMAILYSALRSEYGVIVQAPNTNSAMQALLRAKDQTKDAELKCLQIRKSPRGIPGELWITNVKETQEPSNVP